MKKIIIPILIGFSLVAVSCEKMLDIPQKSTVSTDNFYASDVHAQHALTDMYATYIGQVASGAGIYNPEQAILNYSSDDILAAGGHADDHLDFRVFCEFRYDESNPALKELYNRYTASIYHTNLVISNFTTENRNGTEPKFTSDFTEQCVAEARVMRAYLHMQMAIIWNRPAIIDRLLEGDELPVQAESQSQVLQWVVDECDKAIKSGKLPKRNGTTDKNSTARMSVGFAQFVAGKAAMFNNDPATARQFLGALIDSKDYALTSSEDYWTNFHVSGDGNCEKIFEPNFIFDDKSPFWDYVNRSRWMVADVFCWRTDALASVPGVCPAAGWNGGAVEQKFAKKFLEHDGRSPRRLACFLTEDEWLYELEWNSKLNDASLDEKKKDDTRGIKETGGLFSHGPYFEWKTMSFAKPPKILTGGKDYPGDNEMAIMGGASNTKNFAVARYAEALLLYAEACIGSGDEAKGLKALNEVQTRSGSGKISTSLTFQDVMEEKQYEMWFESCRFADLVRWSKQGKVNLDQVFNKSNIHQDAVNVCDAFFTKGEPVHRLYTEPCSLKFSPFVVGKHEYLPFPRDCKAANHMKDVGGWEYLNVDEPAAE